LMDAFWASLPYLAGVFLVIIIMILFPRECMYLPNLLIK